MKDTTPTKTELRQHIERLENRLLSAESPEDRKKLSDGEIPAHIAMPTNEELLADIKRYKKTTDCRVCGKPSPGDVVIFDKAGTFNRYYCTKCYDLLKRLRASAKEQEEESATWDFEGRDGKNAAEPMLQLAALLREAADKLDGRIE